MVGVTELTESHQDIKMKKMTKENLCESGIILMIIFGFDFLMKNLPDYYRYIKQLF
jgi:hypothetical protein